MSRPVSLAALRSAFAAGVAARVRELWGVEHAPLVQIPPRRELGDLACPAPLHLAKELRRKPREIAEAIVAGLALPAGVREVRVEGAGYLNAFLDRSAFAAAFLAGPLFDGPLFDGTLFDGTAAESPVEGAVEKVILEHTNINPNKAAHIGHLRNAVLGDVLARSLRRLGHAVEVQNYVDDTGVQLADVVVGFLDLRGMDRAAVEAIPEPFDFYCWDLYAEVGRWLAEDGSRAQRRRETLHALESGAGERAELGRLVARRVLHRHLATMRRLGIGYDLLTRESDILALHFFSAAFERLKASGAVRLEAEGKNVGCWVMPLRESAEFAGLEDPDKVIVRSDGTVTYVGKDIAYQLWKLGRLGLDFGYRRWEDEDVWETTSSGGVADHPPFGGGTRVVNVIDARQSYLQKIVRAGLQALGYAAEAERSVHFAYEMVSLSKATARRLGFLDESDEERGKSLEMSGRKGIGVKADDLLDQLEAASRAKIVERYPDLPEAELAGRARDVATAALRFFMAKATTNRVIAFDLDEAIAFEGETGPYLQYSLVREGKIRGKLAEAGMPSELAADEVAAIPAERWSDDLWDLVLAAAQGPEVVEKATSTLELSLVARHALELAGRFHAVYHRHPILQEPDPELRRVRLAANHAFRKGLVAMTDLLGIPVPSEM